MYRIKEQFGGFFIEKLIEFKKEKHNFFTRNFPFLFKAKKEKSSEWFEVSERGFVSGFINPAKKYSTLDEAKKGIENFKCKIHNLD